jgi:hypothetical protein
MAEHFSVPPRGRVTHEVEVSSPGLVSWALKISNAQTLLVEVSWRGAGAGAAVRAVPRMRLGPSEAATFGAPTAGLLTFTLENDGLFGSRAAALELSKAGAPGPTAGLAVDADAAALNALAIPCYAWSNPAVRADSGTLRTIALVNAAGVVDATTVLVTSPKRSRFKEFQRTGASSLVFPVFARDEIDDLLAAAFPALHAPEARAGVWAR